VQASSPCCRAFRRARALAALVALSAWGPAALAAPGPVKAELVASGLAGPTFAAAPPDLLPPAETRLFVLERLGRIRILDGGSVLATPFLDIQAQVSASGEGGLLGLAFAPDYESSGDFYVYYTTATDSVVSRFQVSVDPDVADAGSEEVVLTVPRPNGGHNGGTLAFRPTDGFLYLAPGDGGGSNDPDERAQDGTVLNGKMLRIDVSGGGPGYAVPPANPFVGNPAVLDEIWALGLRNPFRFSFDRATGDLWIGDVGQNQREEVDFEAAADPGGRNYGWDVMEGSLCNPNDPAPAPPCESPPGTPNPVFTLPIYEYGHFAGDCSITGGVVYRGTEIPELVGHYFFGDFCTGRVLTRDPATGVVSDQSVQLVPRLANGPAVGSIVAFGEDAAGEIYVVDIAGELFRLKRAECGDGVDNDGDGAGDFPADPGCSSANAPYENPECDDGVDNDGDLKIDWDGAPPDPQCTTPWKREKKVGCGLGFELAPLLGLLLALRRRAGRPS
jgi:hypothetical protein